MRRSIRNPLTWLVIAEFVVVGALIVLAWSVMGSFASPVIASPAKQAPDAASYAASPLPDVPSVSKPGTGPLPGLSLSSLFWRQRLQQLNREQVYLEQLEWQVVHSALEAAQRYVQTVVVPAIQRAEHAGREVGLG
jgi:hypothetical protein